LKKNLTKATLDNVRGSIEGPLDDDDVRGIYHGWAREFCKQVEVYNNTPKSLTKKTPQEVHFPEGMSQRSEHFTMSAEDLSILEDENEEVNF
jgi:hypothetical protein